MDSKPKAIDELRRLLISSPYEIPLLSKLKSHAEATMSDKTTIRRLREDDLEELYRIRQIAFLDSVSQSNPKVHETHLDRLAYKYGCFVEGQLVSAASWFPFTMYKEGQQQTVGGLASVVSAVTTRRRGHVRALLEHGLEMLREDGVSWCLEYPFDTRYYRRFGWETVSNGFLVEVPIERFSRFDAHVDATRVDVARYEDVDRPTLEHIRRVYKSWASSYTFTLARNGSIRDDWRRVLKGNPWEDGPSRFVFVTEHAYLVTMLDGAGYGERLVVLDYGFESPVGRAEILGFLNNLSGQVKKVGLHLATDDPLVMEWSNFMVPHPHPLQARIVDAAAALSGWKAPDNLDFNVAVSDDFCAWNDAVFRLDVVDGLTRVSRVNEPPDLSLDVRALAQVLSGSVTASAARRAGLATGAPEALEALCALSQYPCHMPLSDYF